jgi:CheY-like chemotaxis protein
MTRKSCARAQKERVRSPSARDAGCESLLRKEQVQTRGSAGSGRHLALHSRVPLDSCNPKPLVLLVDEDVRTTRRLARMLREDGFDVEVARNGAAAISRLARVPLPAALVTEVAMAHADGLTVSRFARSLQPDLPVFVVTGHPELVDQRRFGTSPAVVFTKPIDYTTLQKALLHALGRGDVGDPGETCAETVQPRLECEASNASGDTPSGAQALRALR